MARRISLDTQASFRRAAEKIHAFARHMDKATPDAIYEIAEEIMTDVKSSRPGAGVPRDLGNLANTGKVFGPNDRGEVRLVFGGTAAPYAVVQHERLDFRHEKGEARYLVRGLERWEPGESQAITALRANANAGIRAIRRAA